LLATFLAATFLTAFFAGAFDTTLVATFFFTGDFFVAMVYYPSLVVIMLTALADITANFYGNTSF
jgi:hypothetical protein